MKKFYDTCTLLEESNNLQDVIISSTSIIELENIKTSRNKDSETKFKARKAIKSIEKFNCKIIITTDHHYDILRGKHLELTNDNLIIACAYKYNYEVEKIEFYSYDILCREIAKTIFDLDVRIIEKNKNLYKGYKILTLNNEELANFYENRNVNHFDCLINEYIIINDENKVPCGAYKWNGNEYADISSKQFRSKMFGNIKAYDDIQRCAFDSITNNDITVLYGRSGSGKTTIPLSYIMSGLESQKINKCHCIFHFEPLKHSRSLGYVKGDQQEKKLNTSSIGNILTSKLGDELVVTNLMNSGKLNIMGTYEVRGFEAGSDDVIFVTEAQNIDTYTLKTILQRAKEGCKIILEGDIIEQTDIDREVGLFKMIEVFKGYDKFGCIKLKHNYRNAISELADKLDEF